MKAIVRLIAVLFSINTIVLMVTIYFSTAPQREVALKELARQRGKETDAVVNSAVAEVRMHTQETSRQNQAW
jgi:hypothetical protein